MAQPELFSTFVIRHRDIVGIICCLLTSEIAGQQPACQLQVPFVTLPRYVIHACSIQVLRKTGCFL